MPVRRRAATAGVRTGVLALAALLTTTSCGLADAATAGRGLRRGVDIPKVVGQVADAPLNKPALAPWGEGGYAFSRTHQDGTPVSFDPCRRLHYVVRTTGEPPGGARLLRAALRDVAVATGLRLVHDGGTTEVPSEDRPAYLPERYGERWAPVLIAWSNEEEFPGLAGRVLGRAGPDSFSTNKDNERLVSGIAVFDGPEMAALMTGGHEAKARAVVLHELGHLVGLAHVSDPYQVMYDTNANPLDHYRDGDLRGLEQLGMGRCYRDY